MCNLALLTSCKTAPHYIPVERVITQYKETDSISIVNHISQLLKSRKEKESSTDSIIDRTKEIIVLLENGDTSRYERERIIHTSSRHEKELEQKIAEKDSVISNLLAQLKSSESEIRPKPYPVEVIKEINRLYWWQKSLICIGVIFLIGIPVAVWWLIRKKI